jgi:hypothetical protein
MQSHHPHPHNPFLADFAPSHITAAMSDDLEFERDDYLQDEVENSDENEAQEDLREQAAQDIHALLGEGAQELLDPSAMRERIEVCNNEAGSGVWIALRGVTRWLLLGLCRDAWRCSLISRAGGSRASRGPITWSSSQEICRSTTAI